MIPHNQPSLGPEEIKAAQRVLESGWVAQGPEVEKFENEFCQWMGLPLGHALAVSSGSAAIYLSLISLKVSNKKISIPSYACASLKQAVELAQAQPVYLDSCNDLPHVDLSEENQVDIIIAAHLYGIPLKLNRNQPLIEDCAQALGAQIQNQKVGLQGDVGIFSFSATKLITSGGQGGMIVSQNKNIIDELRDFREFDNRRDQKFRFNFQMTDLQAAIGRCQLKRLPEFLEKREKLFQNYAQQGWHLLDISEKNSEPVRYRAILITNRSDDLQKKLAAQGIKTIIPVETEELLGESLLPQAQWWTQNTLSLPLYPSLTDEQQQHIIQNVNQCLKEVAA